MQHKDLLLRALSSLLNGRGDLEYSTIDGANTLLDYVSVDKNVYIPHRFNEDEEHNQKVLNYIKEKL